MRTKSIAVDAAIVWQGESLLDGAPIVAILTGMKGRSQNPKTGPMAQLWILRADVDPLNAIKTGADVSICGDCGLRGDGHGKGRGCYVTVAQAPNGIYKKFKRGGYPVLPPTIAAAQLALTNVRIRLGAYGDPAALPHGVVLQLTENSPGWTGYTHAFRRRPDLASYVMASADSERDYRDAKALGFRTFRTRTADGALLDREIACPASDEMNHRTSCERCTLCDGARTFDRRKDIAIIVHGANTVHALNFINRKAA